MAFIVAVRMQVSEESLADVLALIQREYRQTPADGQRRRRGRLFQRLGAPTDLLGLAEWESQRAYDAYRSTTTHRAVLGGLAGPSHARYCARLITFERALQAAEVVACALIDANDPEAAEAKDFIVGQGRAEMRAAPGLISHEVYRTHKRPPSFVVVHQWRRLSDLERFRAEVGARHEAILAERGATLERFTGRLAAEYPSAQPAAPPLLNE